MPAHLLDSSAWIECLDNGPNTRFFGPILRKLPDIIVPSIVITEVRKVILSQRSASDAQTVTDTMLAANVIDIDPQIAIQAADLFIQYKLPLADSLIYAIALRHHATLWTQDAHFQGLPHVKFYAKSKQK